MGTYRVKKKEKYTSISNKPIEDNRLTFGARGLLIYLLSKPNEWKIRTAHLVKQSPAGSHALNSLIKELKEHGYMERIRSQKPDGTFEWITNVYEEPTIPQLSTHGLSINGKPPHIVNTEEVSTEKKKTLTPNGAAPKQPTPQQQMFEALAVVTGWDMRINKGRIGKVAAKLIKAKYSAELVKKEYGPGGWWYREDWRGKKGEMPSSPEIIQNTIGKINLKDTGESDYTAALERRKREKYSSVQSS